MLVVSQLVAEEEGDWGADLEGWGGGGAEGCLQGVTCASVLGVDDYDGVLKGTSVSESVSSVDIRLELEINITGPTHTHAHTHTSTPCCSQETRPTQYTNTCSLVQASHLCGGQRGPFWLKELCLRSYVCQTWLSLGGRGGVRVRGEG